MGVKQHLSRSSQEKPRLSLEWGRRVIQTIGLACIHKLLAPHSRWSIWYTYEKKGISKIPPHLSHCFFNLHRICITNKRDVRGRVVQEKNQYKSEFHVTYQR